MRNFVLFLLSLFVLAQTPVAVAQKTAAFRDVEFTYRTALELYSKQKYSMAAKHFEDVMDQTKAQSGEMYINAKYHVAICHLYLFRKDAERLLLDFLRDHPQASQCRTIHFLLAKHYYQQKRYSKAAEYYAKVDKFALNETQLAEYYFKSGHTQFQLGNKQEALVAFNEIRNTENTYQKPATYYYAHISYEDKKYQAALENFLKLEKDPGYDAIVPYYITQIYYYQGEYAKAIEYGKPLLDSVVPKREAELNLILGSSYYNLKKYTEAFPYLDKYATTGAPGREESYRIAYCAMETKQYSKAITWFNKCVNTDDELCQVAWYHIGNTYLNMNKKEESRNAFNRCMKLDFNKTLKEDAHYNYAKLSYELGFNPYHDAISIVKTYIDKYPETPKADELKNYLVHMFVAGKNYESAYTTLSDIKNKGEQLQRAFQLVAFNLGTDYFYKSEYVKSEKYFGEVKKYPIEKLLNAESKYWVGEIHYNQKEWDLAIEGYRRFIEEPGSINSKYYNRAQYNLGYCYMQKGYLSGNNVRRSMDTGDDAAKEHYTQSLVHFRSFVDAKNEKDIARLNDAYLRIGDIYYIRMDNATALTYYDKAYASGGTGRDYALFQKAMCAGFNNQRNDKISMLKTLLEDYKQSKYIVDSKFEIAESYRVLEDRSNALTYYNKVIKDHPDNFMKVKRSRYEIALIHYRNKDYALSEKAYKAILNDYTTSADIDEALNGLKPVYSDQGRIDEWVALVKQYNKFDANRDKADSSYYETAEDYYFKKNYTKAVELLSGYLEQFKPARFELNAYYYLAVSFENLGKLEDAALNYEKVVAYSENAYTGTAIRKLANYYWNAKDYQKAIVYYGKIEQRSTDEAQLLEARLALLRAHVALKQNSEVVNYARKVIDAKNAKDDDKAEAYYYRANIAFESQNMNDAVTDYKMVEKLTQKEWKAEAAYKQCLIKYQKAEYTQTEKDLFVFFKQKPTYNYWLAKGFILLGNNYAQLGDTAQAKATMQSVIDKYNNATDGIIDEAKAELNKMIEAENRQQEQRKMQINTEGNLENQPQGEKEGDN